MKLTLQTHIATTPKKWSVINRFFKKDPRFQVMDRIFIRLGKITLINLGEEFYLGPYPAKGLLSGELCLEIEILIEQINRNDFSKLPELADLVEQLDVVMRIK